MKKEEIRRISFNKSGTNGVTPKMTLPRKWLEKMQINETEREVIIRYNDKEKQIVITKNR